MKNKNSTQPRHLSDGESEQQQNFRQEIFYTLFHAYKPFLGRIIFVLIIGLCGRALLLGNTNVIGYWVDSYCQGELCKDIPTLFHGYGETDFVYTLLAMTLIGLFSTLSFRVIFSRLSARAISSIYDETTLRTSRYEMSFFDNNPAGRIITRFSSDYGNIFRLFGGPLAEFVSIIFDLIMMVVLITVASPFYILTVAIIGLLNFIVYKLNQKKLRALRRELSASRSPSIAHFAETTQGASTIRSFRRIQSFNARFQQLDQYLLDRKLKTTTAVLGFSLQMNILTAVLLLLTGVLAYFMVQNGWASVGSVGVAFTFITLSGNTVQMFFEWLTQFEEAIIGLERMDKYIRQDIEKGAKLPAASQFATPHPRYQPLEEEKLLSHKVLQKTAAAVSIDGLSFKYQEHLPWVLNNINLQILAGERVGIIGKTGSGKSSLIQALFHLYPIQQGKISIDHFTPHLDLSRPATQNEIDLQAFRREISFISQEPVLFLGSLRDNLDIENRLSNEQLLQVLDKVGLGDWVRNHPRGFQLRIEERGKNLSLGERQLLCMARCLLQETPIVIMDEATSSVDPQSEEILVKATEEFFAGKTQIIIAHRLSTLQKCDRVAWIHEGHLKMFDKTSIVLQEFAKYAEEPDLP